MQRHGVSSASPVPSQPLVTVGRCHSALQNSFPFSLSGENNLSWLRAALKKCQCPLPQGKASRGDLAKGMNLCLDLCWNERGHEGATGSLLEHSKSIQEGLEAKFLPAIGFVLHEVHPSPLCPPCGKGLGLKLKEGRFKLNIRRKFLSGRVVRSWCRQSRQAWLPQPWQCPRQGVEQEEL